MCHALSWKIQSQVISYCPWKNIYCRREINQAININGLFFTSVKLSNLYLKGFLVAITRMKNTKNGRDLEII